MALKDYYIVCLVSSLTLISLGIGIHAKAVQADEVDAHEKHFDHKIAPLLAQRCLNCHSGNEPKGGLDLSTRDKAMKGGESGTAIEPSNLSKSPLWQAIDSDTMPPKKPLSADEKALIKDWIEQGAKWGTPVVDPFRFTTDARAGLDWWSLQPLSKVAPPVAGHSVAGQKASPAEWNINPIDAFVLEKLQSVGLSPSTAADNRALVRRLHFDLIGLPPTPEQIREFLDDSSDQAYVNVVNRLLDSPHYGERWGRHWLDVVRFGESNGFEYDEPRDNFWPYRNWVIDVLNQDIPYDQFVRMQIAGDILEPDDRNAIAATGFLVAGPHNTTLPSNDVMRMTMAQDELEDLVGTVGQTFLGLTTNCARCHDHKFDPMSQHEYYQFAATLAGVQHGERTVKAGFTEKQRQRLAIIGQQLNAIEVWLNEVEQPLRDTIVRDRKAGLTTGPEAPQAYATWEFNHDLKDSQGRLHAKASGSAKIVDGCLVLDGKDAFAETESLPTLIEEKTLVAEVQLENLDQRGGGVISVQTTGGVFDAIVFGEREPKKWMSGSDGFVRSKPFNGINESDAIEKPVHIAVVYQKDGTIVAYRNGQPYGVAYRPGELVRYESGKSQVLFGMRHSPPGGNRMLAGRIHRAQLFDRALSAQEVAVAAGLGDVNYVSEKVLQARMSDQQKAKHIEQVADRLKLQSEKKAIESEEFQKIYTCVPKEPGVTKVFRRGNVTDVGDEVAPTGLSAIASVPASLELTPDSKDADRRVKLAQWLTHRDNPLFARVIVNRIWHHHFGQGIVPTTNDFGYNGGKPSHPELLDWLAMQLRDGGYRLKPLHRLIVTSATYRQASDARDEAMKIDADNRLLWRKSPLRIEAEALRDAGLVATGRLDPTIGGKGYRDVKHFFYKGSHFYDLIDEVGSEAKRRTVYRFAPRGGRNPFLDTFDCPDPSVAAPKRASTTTPLQALSLMNNTLVFQMADEFASRVQAQAKDDATQQVQLVYFIAYGRDANEVEIQTVLPFLKQHGLASLCRVVLNSNEFLYVR
jgi:Protein of unknown function (DUF1553)/Protein of unknown function (DUF1549)/Planctomycete cytochrome C/Concanavalin A-like lectin/glucanases superfamily